MYIIAEKTSYRLSLFKTNNFHNKGVYGWNFDAFDFGGIGLITGYRTRGADVKLSMEFCEKWEKRARNATYEEHKQILAEFERELQRIATEFVESKRR